MSCGEKGHELPLTSPRFWGFVALLVTALGLLNFSIVATNWLADHQETPAKYPFVWEMTGAYGALLFLPGLLVFMRCFPIERANVWRRLPLHFLVMGVFGAGHTLVMLGSRTLVYRLLGWGPYHYGEMRYRFLMEGQKQLIVYWLLFAAVSVARYVGRTRERDVLAERLAKQLSDARLSALKTQLQPHFLFNTLNMISSHVYDEPRTADAMIGHLSDFLRSTLRHGDAQEVSLETELEFLSAYLEIMKARFEDRVAVELAIGEGTRPALVPHLILQPLVENSLTHCMDDHTGPGRIRVAAARCGARLKLSIEDDGPGLSADVVVAPRRGIGLSNTVERLRHLYGEDHHFTIANGALRGVRIELDVPYRVAPGA